MISLYGRGISQAFVRNILITKNIPHVVHVQDDFRLDERSHPIVRDPMLAALYLERRFPWPPLIPSNDALMWGTHIGACANVLRGSKARQYLIRLLMQSPTPFLCGTYPSLLDLAAEPIINEDWYTRRIRAYVYPNDDDDDDQIRTSNRADTDFA